MAAGQPLPQPEASGSSSAAPSPPPSSKRSAQQKHPPRTSEPAGLGASGSSLKGWERGPGRPAGEGTLEAGPGRGALTRPARRGAPPAACCLRARPPSGPTPRAPPAPSQRRAGPGVSPHGAISPAAYVRRGHVGLGQLPAGLVDVLLVEALFPGEAHPGHPSSAAPARRLPSRPAGLPAPGPRPRATTGPPLPSSARLCPPRSSPARGRGPGPAARPTCRLAQVRRVRPRPDLSRQPRSPGGRCAAPQERVLGGAGAGSSRGLPRIGLGEGGEGLLVGRRGLLGDLRGHRGALEKTILEKQNLTTF